MRIVLRLSVLDVTFNLSCFVAPDSKQILYLI